MGRLVTFLLLLLGVSGCGNFNHTTRYIIVENREVAQELMTHPPKGVQVIMMRATPTPRRTTTNKTTQSTAKKKPKVTKKASVATGRPLCSPPPHQTLPPTPGIPTDDLRKISPLDRAGVNRLTIKHIEDLRHHIAVIKSQVREMEKQYQQGCRPPATK